MQQLCLLPCKWDDPVPAAIAKGIHHPDSQSHQFSCQKILPTSIVQLHTLSDASEVVYGAWKRLLFCVWQSVRPN